MASINCMWLERLIDCHVVNIDCVTLRAIVRCSSGGGSLSYMRHEKCVAVTTSWCETYKQNKKKICRVILQRRQMVSMMMTMMMRPKTYFRYTTHITPIYSDVWFTGKLNGRASVRIEVMWCLSERANVTCFVFALLLVSVCYWSQHLCEFVCVWEWLKHKSKRVYRIECLRQSIRLCGFRLHIFRISSHRLDLFVVRIETHWQNVVHLSQSNRSVSRTTSIATSFFHVFCCLNRNDAVVCRLSMSLPHHCHATDTQSNCVFCFDEDFESVSYTFVYSIQIQNHLVIFCVLFHHSIPFQPLHSHTSYINSHFMHAFYSF